MSSQQEQLEAILDIVVKLGSRAFNHGVHCEAQQIADEEPKLSEIQAEATQAITALIQEARVDEVRKLPYISDPLDLEEYCNKRLEQLSGGSNNGAV